MFTWRLEKRLILIKALWWLASIRLSRLVLLFVHCIGKLLLHQELLLYLLLGRLLDQLFCLILVWWTYTSSICLRSRLILRHITWSSQIPQVFLRVINETTGVHRHLCFYHLLILCLLWCCLVRLWCLSKTVCNLGLDILVLRHKGWLWIGRFSLLLFLISESGFLWQCIYVRFLIRNFLYFVLLLLLAIRCLWLCPASTSQLYWPFCRLSAPVLCKLVLHRICPHAGVSLVLRSTSFIARLHYNNFNL